MGLPQQPNRGQACRGSSMRCAGAQTTDIYAKNVIVVKQVDFLKQFVSNRFVFSEVFEGFGWFWKLREACGKNFHLTSCKSTCVVTKNKKWRLLKKRLITCESISGGELTCGWHVFGCFFHVFNPCSHFARFFSVEGSHTQANCSYLNVRKSWGDDILHKSHYYSTISWRGAGKW